VSSAAEGLVSERIKKFRQTRGLSRPLSVLRVPLWIVLSAALLVRTVLPLAAMATHHDSSVFVENDTESYLAPAQALLTSGTFSTANRPEIVRTPGYPLFLIPGLVLGHLKAVTIALQIAISTLTVFLVYLTSREVFPETITYWCASFYAIEPLSVFYSSQLMSETLFSFMVVLFLYLIARYIKQPRLTILLAAALVLAAATYVRPISYYLPIVLVPIIFYTSARIHRRHKVMIHALSFLLFCFGLLAPWQIRNYRVAGYGQLSAVGDQNLYFYRSASVIAELTNRSFDDVQKELGFNDWEQYLHVHPDQATWSYGQRYAFMRWEGLQLIRHNLGIYAPNHLRGMVSLIANPGGIVYGKLFKKLPTSLNPLDAMRTLHTLRTNYPVIFCVCISLAVLLLCYLIMAAIGGAMAWSCERDAAILLGTVAVYFVLVSSGSESLGRYRHPIMPIVCLFAGYASACVVRGQMQVPAEAHKTP